jgi:hypothetical protein
MRLIFRSKQQPGRLAWFLPTAQRHPWLLAVSTKRKCLCFLLNSFNSSLQILAYGRPIRSKNLFIGGCDVAVTEVFVLYALVKLVFKHAFKTHHRQLYTLILCSELHWSVSSHAMYYKVCCGCRVSQFSMFLIWKLVDYTRKYYSIFPFQHLLVDIIVSSLLKVVFRVNKEKSHLFSSSHVLRMICKCTTSFKGQKITFPVCRRLCFSSPRSQWWPDLTQQGL